MKRSLLDSLRDPVGHQKLTLVGETAGPDGDIASGALRAEDGTIYPIDRGVPQLLRRDLYAPGQSETIDSFSWKWEKAREYRRAANADAHYTRWYLDRYGFGTEAKLGELLAGKTRILDAGTAHGRDAEMYARNTAGQVFGIDISAGIENAYRDLGHLPNVHFARADLTRLPFPEAFFDFIGCDQVIHHTPDTRAALRALLRHLAPGGHVAFYVYRVKAPAREFCDDHLRAATTRMSAEECYQVSESITKLGKALADLHVTVDVPEDIPLLGIKKGPIDVQRFVYWYMFKCYWNETMDFDTNVITNFDWYHPLHAWRHTPEEVHAWCEEEGLDIVHFDAQESGLSTLARKR